MNLERSREGKACKGSVAIAGAWRVTVKLLVYLEIVQLEQDTLR